MTSKQKRLLRKLELWYDATIADRLRASLEAHGDEQGLDQLDALEEIARPTVPFEILTSEPPKLGFVAVNGMMCRVLENRGITFIDIEDGLEKRARDCDMPSRQHRLYVEPTGRSRKIYRETD